MKLFIGTTVSLLIGLALGQQTQSSNSTNSILDLLSVPTADGDCAVGSQSARVQAIAVASTKIHNENVRTHNLTNANGLAETFPLNAGPVFRMTADQQLYVENVNAQIPQILTYTNVYSDTIRNVTREKLAAYNNATPSIKYSDYVQLYAELEKSGNMPVPLSLNTSDQVFGAMRLGPRGHNLKLVHPQDTTYNKDLESVVTSSLVQRVCGEASLRSVIEGNRVFVSDFTNITQFYDTKTTLDKFGVETRGYFCFNAGHELFLPLAIAILDSELVYTSDDSADEWQFAKMALDAMELNFVQMRHFAEVHMVGVPIQVEMMRTMAISHPIYQLLTYHFSPNFALEIVADQTLWVLDSPYDKILTYGARGSLRFVLDEFLKINVSETAPEEYTRRGLQYLPIHRLTKYGLRYFETIGQFVKSFLAAYYRGDSDLVADCELQRWAKSMQSVPDIHGFPSEFTSFEQLQQLITHLIFQNAVKHHFMNGIVTWHGSSAPFSTPSLWNKAKGIPKEKGVAINPLDYAMPPKIVEELTYFKSLFYRPRPREITLLDVYKNTTFEKQPKLLPAVEKMRADMTKMEADMQTEEKNMTVPLDFFRPSQLPYLAFI